MTHAFVQCEQCGQLDDHPMVHILGGRSVHHDCLSASERSMVVGSSPVAAQIVEECEAGLHGDALRARIEELQAEADAASEADEPVEDVIAAFDAGEQGLTAPSVPDGAVVGTEPATFGSSSDVTVQRFDEQPVQADEVEPPGGCVDCGEVDETPGPLADEQPVPGDSAGTDETLEG